MKTLISIFIMIAMFSALFGSRKALIIGNSEYTTAPLRNPVNDARLMKETLLELGFEVTYKYDLDSVGFYRAIRDFSRSISIDDEVFFYYSGHAVQIDGENYLLPVKDEIDDEITARRRSMPLNDIMDYFRNASLNIVVLDACRDNPFTSFRSASRGLAQISPRTTNYYIVYSTQPGDVAEDGMGQNSIFTEAFSNTLRTPGLSFDEVINNVSRTMNERTGGRQRPHRSTTIDRSVYLNPAIELPEPGEEVISPAVTTAPAQREIQPEITADDDLSAEMVAAARPSRTPVLTEKRIDHEPSVKPKSGIRLGVRGGMNLSSLSGDDPVDLQPGGAIDMLDGFHAGILANMNVGGNYILQLEWLYSEKGYNYDRFYIWTDDGPLVYEGEIDAVIHHVEVPVLIKYDLRHRSFNFQPYLGVTFSFMADCWVDYYPPLPDGERGGEIEDYVDDFDFGFNAGIDTLIFDRIILGLRYNIGTGNASTSDLTSNTVNTLMFGLGFMIF